jgi:hypothetical protein
MEIYDVAARLKEAEGRMRNNITDFEAAAAREWAEKKKRIDNEYSAEMEGSRKKLSAKSNGSIAALSASFKESLRQYKSFKSKVYLEEALGTIKEVLGL